MKILEKGIMTDGTKIQIEEWSEDYSFKPYGSTIGAYPKSKQSLEGQFSPKRNKTFRLQLNFNSYEEAQEAFNKLVNGEDELISYENYLYGKKELLSCI